MIMVYYNLINSSYLEYLFIASSVKRVNDNRQL